MEQRGDNIVRGSVRYFLIRTQTPHVPDRSQVQAKRAAGNFSEGEGRIGVEGEGGMKLDVPALTGPFSRILDGGGGGCIPRT